MMLSSSSSFFMFYMLLFFFLSLLFASLSSPASYADVINNTSSISSSSSGRQLYSYALYNFITWVPSVCSNLTYALTSTSTISIPASSISRVFARAFARWAAVTKINFTEVGPADRPRIKIGFYRGDHGDGVPFDGPHRVLGHSFPPPFGILHMDADENWVTEGEVGEGRTDMETVAVHEIGHVLGLGHSKIEEAVMYFQNRRGKRKVELAKDDVDGVQSLYGVNPNYIGPPKGNPLVNDTGSPPPEVGKPHHIFSTSNGGGGLMVVRGWVNVFMVISVLLLVVL